MYILLNHKTKNTKTESYLHIEGKEKILILEQWTEKIYNILSVTVLHELAKQKRIIPLRLAVLIFC